ncbi:hypothetical protein FSF01_12505 [Listeria monocytogenes]|nr:hypothetical protein [Listeria monocytogenes]EAC4042146.1 hypothetical protein [Listeria monocytogenes]EAC5806323.1 hypothetical protein [Listeria monocytogenes]EAC6740452.1 hypothetical protein [Listeria monocytogenes]EAC7758557.1 hypothetical protein [Listeria monocytogenes]
MNNVIFCYKEPYFIMVFKESCLNNSKKRKLMHLIVMEKFSNSYYFSILVHLLNDLEGFY